MDRQKLIEIFSQLRGSKKKEILIFFTSVIKATKKDYLDSREEELNKVQVPLIVERLIAEFDVDGKNLIVDFEDFKSGFKRLKLQAEKFTYVKLF